MKTKKEVIKDERNEHGRIYELLTDSFKKKYETININ